jgi:hypothetical protein
MLQGVKVIPEHLILEDGANMVSHNVGNQLPTYTAQHPRGKKIIPSSLTDIPSQVFHCEIDRCSQQF